MRPTVLEEFVGQRHLLAGDAPLGKMIEAGHITSMILWGPPGVGKTTLAEIIARRIDAPCYKLSAVGSGVADVRKVLEQASQQGEGLFASRARPILFIDEIHRFSKSQQDSLLAAIERGVVTLIGATTENPSFEIIRPLLSRCQIFVLQSLTKEDLGDLLQRAITDDSYLKTRQVELMEQDLLLRYAAGDARKLLGLLELIALSQEDIPLRIDNALVEKAIERQPIAFDKEGEMHYDIASAMIKSIRGSDPDAALYWMARLIEGGEPPRFIARRLVISAAEDIGLANPQAIVVAQAAAQAVDFIGWPEGRIPLAEAILYLAASPKSNSAYLAVDAALAFVKETGNLPVPMHLRNAPTQFMKQLGYGEGYRYPHDYPLHYVEQQYLPDEAQHSVFYQSQTTGASERQMRDYLQIIADRSRKKTDPPTA